MAPEASLYLAGGGISLYVLCAKYHTHTQTHAHTRTHTHKHITGVALGVLEYALYTNQAGLELRDLASAS